VGTLGVLVIADKRDESLVCRGSGKSVSTTGYRLNMIAAHGNMAEGTVHSILYEYSLHTRHGCETVLAPSQEWLSCWNGFYSLAIKSSNQA
jgi:hypothetical protein